MQHEDCNKNIAIAAFSIGIVAVIFLFSAVKAMDSVLKPIAFAWVLASMLSPLVNTLTKKFRFPEIPAIIASLAVSVFAIFEAGVLINTLVKSFVAKYPEYIEKLKNLLETLYATLPQQVVDMLRDFDWQTGVSKQILSLSGSLISISTTTVIVMIIAAFMLIEKRDFALKAENAFNAPERVRKVITSITSQVSRYLVLQFVISAATGLAIWGALALIGIDFAATWGVLAFTLNFIPTIGSILASIPPLVIALVQYAPESFMPFAYALVAILVIQMGIGNVISPRVMGDGLNLSPVAVLVSLLFWGWLWGPAGALLSTPITAAIKIICDNIEPLEPIGTLLGSARQFRKAARQ